MEAGIVLAYLSAMYVLFLSWHYLFAGKTRPVGLPDSGVPLPLVSIVVPARNERRTLPQLLESLTRLDYPTYEIIVVDDNSSDGTVEVVQRYPVRLIKALPKPEGWVGKSWACHLGAQAAQGALLLFTDADTVHLPRSLSRAVAFAKHTGATLVSAPSFHRNGLWWERLLAPFYFLINIPAALCQSTAVHSTYAIGQYLLFDASFYSRIGGHASVKASLAEDVALARRCLRQGGDFRMFTDDRLYEVQMFGSFREFASGWVRLLRLGMHYLSPLVVLTSLLILYALASADIHQFRLVNWLPTLLTLACIGAAQRYFGHFPLWGLLFFPLSVLLFVVLASYAGICHLLRRPLTWHGRIYPLAYRTFDG